MIVELLLLFLNLGILVFAGQVLVRSLDKIGAFLRISQFAAAFIFMSISTSMPELFVGIGAALQGMPEISLGNVIGSNIANITLVAGLGLLLAGGQQIGSKTVKRDSLYMFFISLIPILLLFIGGELSRIDGVILLAIYLWYNWILIKENRHFSKHLKNHIKRTTVVGSSFIFIIGIIALYFSSFWAVHYASIVADGLGISTLVVGLVLIALGTSLPELTFTISSLLSDRGELSLGNLIGSVIANSTLILAVTSIITPIHGMGLLLGLASVFMVFSLFLFATFVESAKRMTTRQGLALIMLYIVFIIVQVYVPA